MLPKPRMSFFAEGEMMRNAVLHNLSRTPSFYGFLSEFFSGDDEKILKLILNGKLDQDSGKGVFNSDYYHDKEIIRGYHSTMDKYLRVQLPAVKQSLLEKPVSREPIFIEYGQRRTIEATSRFLSCAIKRMISDCQRVNSELLEKQFKENYQKFLQKHH